VNAEALGGYRLGEAVGADFFGGFGIENWIRDLLDGKTVTGETTTGYTEQYWIAYAKLGIGGYYVEEQWQLRGHVGAKYPVWTYERVYLSDVGFDDDVTLHPGKKTSWFARLQLDLTAAGARQRTFVALYYDTLRLSESPAKTVSDGSTLYNVRQPKSDRDVIGIEIGLSF
jgi:hypothetical protein